MPGFADSHVQRMLPAPFVASTFALQCAALMLSIEHLARCAEPHGVSVPRLSRAGCEEAFSAISGCIMSSAVWYPILGGSASRLGGVLKDASATSAAIRVLTCRGARTLRVSLWIDAVLVTDDARRRGARRDAQGHVSKRWCFVIPVAVQQHCLHNGVGMPVRCFVKVRRAPQPR